MDFFGLIFADAPNKGLVEFAHGYPPHSRRWYRPEDLSSFELRQDRDTFFAPGLRKSKGSTKDTVLGSRVLWVDIDNTEEPIPTLLPSISVFSGHGHHLYWILEEWCEDVEAIERGNKALAIDTGADDCWNANRLLRIPGTTNLRGEVPVACVVRQSKPDRVYRLEEFGPLSRLDPKARRKIRTGSRRGYRSRSERDWAVVCALVDAGADNAFIYRVFEAHEVGDKYREEGKHYLDLTISKAQDRTGRSGARSIVERDDGYYIRSKRATRRISTFTFHPRLLLNNLDTGPATEDAIVGSVRAGGRTWDDITFTRSAFNTVDRLDRETPRLSWQWLGGTQDVRLLLPFLLDQLEDQGLPRTLATGVLGLHTIRNSPYFVGDRQTLGAEDGWTGSSGPLVYLDPRREHAKLALEIRQEPDPSTITRLLPDINRPEVFWPMVGWYAAAPLKPAFERLGLRFPILNVHGTRGSGKTTSIQRVMMPLFGQKEPRAYDANTTRFVILSLLGSSNAVPVAFSEFRFGSADKFLRYVLLAYDTGHDPRGRADQTTVDYPLSAPFSVDGEDLIADPAAKERIIPVTMRPDTIAEGSPAHKAYAKIELHRLELFGAPYIRHCLGLLVDGQLREIVKRASDDLFRTYPKRLPDRVRNNFTVAWAGVRIFTEYAGLDLPDCTALGESIRTCYDIEAGRSATYADGMVEDLVNATSSPRGASDFSWRADNDDGRFWFQLASAHSWWLASRRRQNRGSLERDAIRNQLVEAPYIGEPERIDGTIMYPVDLAQAQRLGLDVPDHVDQTVFRL